MMSIEGRFSGLIPGSTKRLGPIRKGEAYSEKKGSVMITLPSSLISKVLCPIHVIVLLSFNFCTAKRVSVSLSRNME